MGKRKRQKSPGDSTQRFPLWQLGLLLIVAGPIGNKLAAIALNAPAVPITAAQQGQAFGRGLVTVLAIVTGVVLIILHFVRRNRH